VVAQLQSPKYSGLSWHGAVKSSAAIQGLITSGGVGGALLGATIVFRVADALGRRRELLIGSWLYVFGAALEFLSGGVGGLFQTSEAFGLALLVAGRIVYGVGCGFVMHAAPAYIGEMSPAAIRGTLVSLKEAAIVLGISLGYGVGYAYRDVVGGWRYVFGWSAPLALVLFRGALRLPPSARWLALRGRAADARKSLAFVYPSDADALNAAVAELGDAATPRGPSPSLWKRQYRRALTAGLGVVLLQQFTGQPSVLYYATSIFDDAGVGTIASVFVGVFKLLATLVAVATVDERGRRSLLFAGISAMTVALFGLAAAFYDFDGGGGWTVQKVSVIGLVFVYIAAYQLSFGPIAWLLISEVFPLEVRGQAVALAVQANFASNLLVAFLFPVARDGLSDLLGDAWGMSALFATFGAVAVYALYFVHRHVPETKGMSLEAIERFLAGEESAASMRSPLISSGAGDVEDA